MTGSWSRGRRIVAAAALAVTVCLVGSGCSTQDDTARAAEPSRSERSDPAQADRNAGRKSGTAELPPSRPVSVWIPRIDARSTLVPVGLNSDGTLEVPPVSRPMQAAWYEQSPTPGERGPSVLLGHVDGGGEPGIFYRLRELRPGDTVLVERRDGQRVEFVIRRVDQVAKDAFPTERVYGNTDGPEIRLITCGGSFDENADSYRDNIIAYGTLRGS